MKMMIAFSALFVLAALFAFGMDQGKPAAKSGVGSRPGGIEGSLDISRAQVASGRDLAVFAAGCFWGVEERFRQIPGVIATAVGYIGGRTTNPTYKQVCTDETGHAEAVLIEFDPARVSYAELVDVFYKNHNPTTLNRQGPDYGSQYRSAIFYRNPAQKKVASAVTASVNKEKFNGKVVTQIVPSAEFWMAEEYHQQYCAKNGIAACPIR